MILRDDHCRQQDADRRAQREAARIAAGLNPETGIRYRSKRRIVYGTSEGSRGPVPGVPVLPGYCQCGCGDRPKQRRSRFLPGHDSRMPRH